MRVMHILTLSKETKSAACSSVSPEMSSTILFSFGSVEVGGGGGVCEVEGVASVANHRELPDRSAELHNRKSASEGREERGGERSRSFRLYGFAGSPGEVYA